MAIATMADVVQPAFKQRYGVAAFNIVDFGSMKAIIDAASAEDAPVIIQTSVKTVKLWSHREISSWYRVLAENVEIPVVLHLDHCKEPDFAKACVDHGWTSVMLDGSSFPFEENMRLTREVLRYAHDRGAGLEGELGEIAGVEDDEFVSASEAHYADPELCRRFLSEVPVDVFAPNIGTAHGVYHGEPKVNFELVKQVAEESGVPLALHGGSGLSREAFHRCIENGCAKVNISTNLKHAFVESVDAYRGDHPNDYEPTRIIAAQYQSIYELARNLIAMFGGSGAATNKR